MVNARYLLKQKRVCVWCVCVMTCVCVCLCSVADKGAEACKDVMEAFAACVKSAAEPTS